MIKNCKYCGRPVIQNDLLIKFGLVGGGVEIIHNHCAQRIEKYNDRNTRKM